MLGGLARCYCGAPAYGTRNSRERPATAAGRWPVPGRDPASGHVCRLSGLVDDYVSAVIVERLSWPDAVDVPIDHDRPDVDALRDRARVLRARLEEIAASLPTIPPRS